MFMKHFSLILLIALGGCANYLGTPTHEYDQYLADFNSDLMRLGYSPIDFNQTVIHKGNTPEKARANCDSGTAVRKSGIVHMSVSNSFDENQDHIKRAIVYHELGHCFLGLDHSEGATKWIMTARDLSGVMSLADFSEDSIRLQYVQEMLNISKFNEPTIF